MKMQLIRHATLLLEFNGYRILVDPMLSPKETMPPILNSTNDRRNPLVDLPLRADSLTQVDAIIITHCHPDHFDETAKQLLPKQIPVFCQPSDRDKLQEAGFSQVNPIQETLMWNGIRLDRTGGQHGTGEIGKLMGIVSGFVLHAEGEPSVYIAGDTIWCEDVEHALATYTPTITVLNTGAAQFATGDPITMDVNDIVQVCQFAPNTQIIAVHMDSINHCLLTRNDLRHELEARALIHRVLIPEDGEWVGDVSV
ncbi:MBL fold metallo-hydrolase [Brevibacillus sp. SYSU BS000544]|uniref:MBL fold metallo-hydrolase n=1 Tax=Brevibacillus sp. SYSU BS000544 TaxID=3416443 RepID=UPI003CE47518